MKCYNWLVLSLLMVPLSVQSQSTYSIGGAAVYGDDIGSVGFNTRLYQNSKNHRFCIGPEFTYFPKKTESIGSEISERTLFELNFNAHYIFELVENLGAYPLTGLNYSQEKEELFEDNELIENETIREFGWNVGFGLHYQLNSRWLLFTEYDYLISDLQQSTIAVGILYTFGKGFKVGGHHKKE